MGMFSGKLPVALGVQVYQALVRPILEFAAEVTSITSWPQAEEIQWAMAKRILQCRTHTSNIAVMGELGWHSIEARHQQLRVCFWFKIHLMPNHAPTRLVYEESLRWYSTHAAGDEMIPAVEPEEGWDIMRASENTAGSNFWCAQLKRDLFTLGLARYWNDPSLIGEKTLLQWKRVVQIAVAKREAARWWRSAQVQPILRTYVTFKLQPQKLEREAYLDVPHGGWNDRILIGRRALTQLRCGTHGLAIHIGRYSQTAVEARFCVFCADGHSIEDERHFFLECELYADRRQSLWSDVNRIVQESSTRVWNPIPFDATKLTPDQQFTLLTCGPLPVPTGNVCARRVMSRVLIEVAERSRIRDEFIDLMERARMTPTSSSTPRV